MVTRDGIGVQIDNIIDAKKSLGDLKATQTLFVLNMLCQPLISGETSFFGVVLVLMTDVAVLLGDFCNYTFITKKLKLPNALS